LVFSWIRCLLILVFSSLGVLNAEAQTTKIRIVASNLTSGNNQSYESPGSNILRALKADVVLLQEFKVTGNQTSVAATDAWVSSTFGPGYFWYREPFTSGIPNGIVSKYPFLATGEFDDTEVGDRDHAWARIDVPGSKDLYVVSVHLSSGGGASTRTAQAQAIVNTNIPSLSIPIGSYLVIGGDFNTDNRTEGCVNTFSSIVSTGSPWPVGRSGDGDTNAGRNKPFDWVVPNTALRTFSTPSVYGTFSFSNGFVFDSREFSQAELNTEFSPVLVSDSAATNMQHMGVVRDFIIPSEELNYTVSPTTAAFGTQDAGAKPFTNNAVTVTPATSITITSSNLSLSSEFSLVSPTLPATISAATPLTFRWNPSSNDGSTRNTSVVFQTNSSPASFNVFLSGTTLSPAASFSVSGSTTIAYGTVDAGLKPFRNNQVTLNVITPFTLTGVQFVGTHQSEFTVQSPTLPAVISVNTPIVLDWNPITNDGGGRSVLATFTTNASPSTFQLTLGGATIQSTGGGLPLDIGGYRIEQIGGAGTFTIPAGTVVQPGGTVVLARNATKAVFETGWGVALGSNVVYLNNSNGSTGLPVINGGEQFRILTAASAAVDPTSGHLPTVAISAGQNYQRGATNGTTFTNASSGTITNANPGNYSGIRAGTGKLVVSEISDASDFNLEFVEFFYDALLPTKEGWMLR